MNVKFNHNSLRACKYFLFSQKFIWLLITFTCGLLIVYDGNKQLKLNQRPNLTIIKKSINEKSADFTLTNKIFSTRTHTLSKTSKITSTRHNTVPKCDYISQKLIGYKPYSAEKLKIRMNDTEIESKLQNQNISFGGKWEPSYCKARNRVAILIPYRNREQHLEQFLFYMHPLFARQELSYKIYLIEPVENITFNRGILMNIGFIESNKDSNDTWQCHAYHDVDLISEDDRTIYTCGESPKHMAHRISKFKYKPFYPEYFGGVTLVPKDAYIKSNGYSNQYFGWGAEDDDHYNRLKAKGYSTISPMAPLGRYLMLFHEKDKPNPIRHKILQDSKKRIDYEGLNSVKYRIVETIKTKLYTKLLVYYNETELLQVDYRLNSTTVKATAAKKQ